MKEQLPSKQVGIISSLTFSLILFSQLVYGQVVNIGTSPNPISVNVVAGENADQTFTITNTGNAQLEWESEGIIGEKVLFSKEDFVNWNLQENQDRITADVWITRGNNQGIFNIKSESSFSGSISPEGTEWAYGNTVDLTPDAYTNWRSAIGSNPPGMVGNVISMHAIEEDRYFDIEFISWTNNSSGGGFSYTRVEPFLAASLSTNSGTILAGASEDVVLTVDASTLAVGTYSANIVISSNATSNPDIIIPIEITVTGGESVLDLVGAIDFNNEFIGGNKSEIITVANNGAADLVISNIASDNNVFTASVNSLMVPGYSSREIIVSFSPAAEQTYSGVLTITSNDAGSPTEVTLAGTGIVPPVIAINATSFGENLDFGGTSTQTLTISNTGNAALNWSAKLVVPNSSTSFTKQDFGSVNDEINQDKITDNVWLTRSVSRGLYNIAQESSYTNSSPAGTEWIDQSTQEALASASAYTTWRNAHDGCPPCMVGETYSMRTLNDNRYFDVQLLQWTEDGNGGGFSYNRTETPGWITLSEYNGSIATTESTNITMDFEANRFAGTHQAQLILTTNDPLQSEIIIPVTITISGAPQIELPLTSFDLSDVYIGASASIDVEIANPGSEILNITELSIDNSVFTITPITGSIAAGQSGLFEVTYTPTTSGPAAGVLTVVSDDPINSNVSVDLAGTGVVPPTISVAHNELIVDLDGDVYNESINIENTGGSDLQWTITGEGETSVTNTLTALNSNFDLILSQLPNRYSFNYDGGPNNINDGGNDIYDNGNQLYTNLSGSSINYSDNIVADGTGLFGEGTSYFTRHLDGLFVLVADLNGVTDFTIDGNIGADGSGNVSGPILEVVHNGKEYQGFVKIVAQGGDPSIHHVVILEKNVGASHEYDLTAQDDYHRVMGLSETDRLYYLLFANADQSAMSNEGLRTVMTTFLNAIAGLPEYITLSSDNGTTASGASESIALTIDPATVPSGVAGTELMVISNDLNTPSVTIPITFTSTPKLVISSSNINFGNVFQGYDSPEQINVVNNGAVSLEISNIASNETQFSIEPTSLTLAAGEEGVVTVTYTPTADGSTQGTITLTTNDPANESVDIIVDGTGLTAPNSVITPESMSFKLFPGESGTETISIENTQGINLDWNITPSSQLSVSSGSTAAGSTATVDYTVLVDDYPAGVSKFELVVQSNDPDAPEILIPVTVSVGNVRVENIIEDVIINEGFGTSTINITEIFLDADNDVLTYSPASSREDVVSLALAGNELNIIEAGIGTSQVSIRATDGVNAVFANFIFRVNAVPNAINPISDQSYENAFSSASVNISDVFVDADVSDELSYSASVSESGVVSVAIVDDSLVITEEGPGTVTVTLTADDGFGGVGTTTFEVFVNKIDQTLTFNSLENVTYGDASFNLVAAATSGLEAIFESSDPSVATIEGDLLSIVGAGTVTITASQPGNEQYNAAVSVEQSFEVLKAELTVTAIDASFTIGSVIEGLQVSYAGFVNGDDESSLLSAPIATTTATSTSNLGEYVIVVAGGESDDYSFIYVDGVLTISEITANNKNHLPNVKLYPNPVQSYFVLSTGVAKSEVQIINVAGALVKSITNFNDGDSIEISDLESGVYIVRIQTGDAMANLRLVKQ